MNGLFVRAAIAVLVLPGVVAFLIPLWLFVPGDRILPSNWWGLVPVAAGSVLLAACIREFYVAGRGTLAPWSPPQALVVTGPYQRSRNPMYVAVLLILSGWAISYGSWTLVLYALAVLILFHLRVLWHEEPWLTRTFGDSWVRYRARVPRWV